MLLKKKIDEQRLRNEEIKAKVKAEIEEKAKLKAQEDALRKAMQDARLKALADAEAERIAKIAAAKLASEEALKAKQASVLNKKSKNEEFLDELAKKYPPGITEENEDGVNFKLTRIIIVKGGKADEYKKIVYNYGGVFWQKNNVQISEVKYKLETKN